MESLNYFVKNRTVNRMNTKNDGLGLAFRMFLLAWVGLIGVPQSFSEESIDKKAEVKGTSRKLPLLKTVISEKMIGLQFEDENLQKTVKENAKKLTLHFKDKLSHKLELEWIEKCKGISEESDGFCAYMVSKDPEISQLQHDILLESNKDLSKDPDDLDDGLVPPASTNAVIEHFKKGELDALLLATSSQLYSALKRIKDPEVLKKVIDQALEKKESFHCKNPIIATSLAQKCESFFPSPELKEKMYSLYLKVRSCKGGGLTNANVSPVQLSQLEAVDRAKFRYSIHKISEGKCEIALPFLDELYATGNLEYNSRALYWKAICAEKSGDKLKFSTFKQKLLKEAPLSYHNILLSGSEMGKVSQVLSTDELVAYFRSDESFSKESKKINSKLRVVEGLLAVNSVDYARKVFIKSSTLFLKAEPEVKLYMSVLAERMNDPITQFRFVASAFREKSELINQNTLRLFYPLKNYEAIESNSAKLDPFFVAALIRQESGFNQNARSRVGAVGLMQLMPATARRLEHVSRSMLWNPKVNIRLGSKYIGRLVQFYDSDAEMALAAYNAGENIVNQWKDRYVGYDRMAFLDLIPYKETRDYIALISRNFFWYHKLYGNAFRSPIEKRGVMSVLKSSLKGSLRADVKSGSESSLMTQNEFLDSLNLKQSSSLRIRSSRKKQDGISQRDSEALLNLLTHSQ